MDEERAPTGKVGDQSQTVAFGPFRFDRRGLLLSKDGIDLPVQPKPLTVLRCLVDRPGEVLLKNELMDLAWDDAAVTENSLAEAIRMLRRALGDDPRSPEYIETVHRRGYRFIAPVTELRERPDEAAPSAALEADGRSWPLPQSTFARRSTAALSLIAVGLAVGAAGAGFFSSTASEDPESSLSRVALMLPDDAPVRVLRSFLNLSISPDGRTAVYEDPSGDLYARYMDNTAPQRIEAPTAHGARSSPPMVGKSPSS